MYETKQKRNHWNKWVQWGLIHKPVPATVFYTFSTPPPQKSNWEVFRSMADLHSCTGLCILIGGKARVPPETRCKNQLQGRVSAPQHVHTHLRLQQCVQNSPFQAFQCWTWDSLNATTTAATSHNSHVQDSSLDGVLCWLSLNRKPSFLPAICSGCALPGFLSFSTPICENSGAARLAGKPLFPPTILTFHDEQDNIGQYRAMMDNFKKCVENGKQAKQWRANV